MSDRYAKACAQKRHYRSERRAADAAKDSQIIFGQPMKAYPCPIHKGQWCVGSTYASMGRTARLERENAA
jgi:hypothetical protein